MYFVGLFAQIFGELPCFASGQMSGPGLGDLVVVANYIALIIPKVFAKPFFVRHNIQINNSRNVMGNITTFRGLLVFVRNFI